jgi:hypothetical protein
MGGRRIRWSERSLAIRRLDDCGIAELRQQGTAIMIGHRHSIGRPVNVGAMAGAAT